MDGQDNRVGTRDTSGGDICHLPRDHGPSLLRTLLDSDDAQVDTLLHPLPGGLGNVQDIYPFSPLQTGMLFDCLLAEHSDMYTFSTLLELSSRSHLDSWILALNTVIQRHDSMRTSLIWHGLKEPAQVVHRHATLDPETVVLRTDQDPLTQLKERMSPGRQCELDLRRAPLARLFVAADPHGPKCYALLQIHHLISDLRSLKVMINESMACMEGRRQELNSPGDYYRYLVETRNPSESAAAETYFRETLGDIAEPVPPLGLLDVRTPSSRINESRQMLDTALADRVRSQARLAAVSAARIFHAAWALVVAHTTGQETVIYGTVLSALRRSDPQSQSLLALSVNTLPLRLPLRDLTAKTLLENTHQELTRLATHARYPLAWLGTRAGLPKAAHTLTTIFNYRHSAHEADWHSQSGVRVIARGDAPSYYPVTMSVDERPGGFLLTAQTDQRISAQRVIRYFHSAIDSLVEALAQSPLTSALSLPIIPSSERQQLITIFNDTRVTYSNGTLVHELFEKQVDLTPNAIAVEYGNEAMTYSQLNSRANQLAYALRRQGLGPDGRVAICVERGLEMIVAVIGTLKAGAAYVPMDPSHPPERLAFMLRDAAPRVLLIQERLRARLPVTTANVIALDTDWQRIAAESTANLDSEIVGLRSDHLAYVIYTSGSTGTPKGVMVRHAGLVNYLQWAIAAYTPEWGEAAPVSSPLAFDATVTSLYCPLLVGRSTVLIPEGEELDGLEHLLRTSRRWSLIKISPAHLQGLGQRLRLAGLPCNVGVFVIGGESLPATTVALWRSIWPEVRLVNEYGPTETVVGCSTYEIPPTWVSESSVPIGRPIANTQMYILDSHRQLVPIGVPGEIYIGGAGVARGYLNEEQLTAQRFILSPFADDPHARLYMTGDRGRVREDGIFEYLGRADDQVKIRGFRIELGEIDAHLARCPHVKEGLVLAREDSAGERRLVAYVVPDWTSEDIPLFIQALRGSLKAHLPDHMIPSAFVILQSLPLTRNGKVDRRALPPPPSPAGHGDRDYEPPSSDTEKLLAGMWREVLRVDQIGRSDNLFSLGGHSILAMKIAARVQSEFSIDLPIRTLFEHPTIEQLAAEVDRAKRRRLLTRLAENGLEAASLLDTVASMSESRVHELITQLSTEGGQDEEYQSDTRYAANTLQRPGETSRSSDIE